jgi:hypothetical protein
MLSLEKNGEILNFVGKPKSGKKAGFGQIPGKIGRLNDHPNLPTISIRSGGFGPRAKAWGLWGKPGLSNQEFLLR